MTALENVAALITSFRPSYLLSVYFQYLLSVLSLVSIPAMDCQWFDFETVYVILCGHGSF